jgi:hypothetical protein
MISVTIAMVTIVQRQYSCGVSGFLENCFFDDFDFRTNENYDFKSIDLLIVLGSLMICTHDLYVLHQTKKKRSAIANRSDTVAKALSTNVSIVLTELVYLQKNGSNIPILSEMIWFRSPNQEPACPCALLLPLDATPTLAAGRRACPPVYSTRICCRRFGAAAGRDGVRKEDNEVLIHLSTLLSVF